MLKKIACCFVCLYLASCTLHPRYKRETIAIDPTWRITTEENEQLAQLLWWKEFKDPHLDALVEEALLNNQDLQVAIYRVDAYAAKVGIAASLLYPQLIGDGEASRGKVSTSVSPLPSGQLDTTNLFSVLLKTSFQTDIFGRIRSATQAAQAQLLAQIENRRAVVLALVSNVAASYIRLKLFYIQTQIANETLRTRQEAYKLALVRYELGLTSRMEVDQARSEVEEAQVIVKELEISLALSEDLISLLLGKPSMSIEVGTSLENLEMPVQIPVALPSQILNQRPDILAAEQLLVSANADIGVARANFFPDISLTGALGTQSQHLSNFLTYPSAVYEYGSKILQEIFTGGRLTSALNLSRAEKAMALHNYQQVILKAFQEVNDALISHQVIMQLLVVQKEQVQTYSDYLYLSYLRYDNGDIDYLTVLDAQRQLFKAQLAYADTQARSFISLIEIYQALGGGWLNQADEKAQTTHVKPQG